MSIQFIQIQFNSTQLKDSIQVHLQFLIPTEFNSIFRPMDIHSPNRAGRTPPSMQLEGPGTGILIVENFSIGEFKPQIKINCCCC